MDKAKKKRIKRYSTWAGIAAVVLLLTALPLLAKNSPETDGPRASVLSAEVESGGIHQVINGGGTLTSTAVDVKIPDGVRITQFLVKNGDHVTAGTPVAAVDKVSVLAAMSEVEDTLDYLRDEIEDAKDETVSSTIHATTGGRVKKVFAQPGQSVQDVMLRDGCLALLSVDGKMAVKFEMKSDVATGQDIDVTLADGSIVTGRVESNLNGEVIVTVEDEGYAIGAVVSVAGLGEGTLYVHNPWKATAISGTISTVSAKEEKTVSAGSALFTLTDTEYTGQWEHRIHQHQEYEELLQRLTQMYRTGTIDAPCDGVISGVDENSGYLLAAEQGQWEIVPLTNSSNTGTVRLMLLSDTTTAGCTGDAACQYTGNGDHKTGCPNGCCNATAVGACKSQNGHADTCLDGCTKTDQCPNTIGYHQDGCPRKCTKGSSCPAEDHEAGCYKLCKETSDPSKCPNAGFGASQHKKNCIHKCTSGTTENGSDDCAGRGGANHYTSCIESCDSAKTEKAACDATGTHKKTCIRSCVRADVTGVCRTGRDSPHYVDCIESCTESPTCPSAKHKGTCDLYGMTYTAQIAKVDSVGNTELVVYWDASFTQYPAERSGTGWKITGQVEESLLITSGTLDLTNTQEVFHKGDIVLAITGYKNGSSAYTTVALYKSASTGGPGAGGSSGDIPEGAEDMASGVPGGVSGMTGGFSGSGSYDGTSGEDEGLYDLEGQTLLTVIQQETMTISISVDEQDISRVSIGMEAAVEINARPGRTYTAVISSIGFTGENDGGSSKFPVELTLEADQDMLDGMSATVQIILETKEDIPVIPLAALNGDSVNIYVYTALDKETGEPANPVNVEIGLSDDENVEILSGLSLGDKVYYHYYDVLELDTSA